MTFNIFLTGIHYLEAQEVLLGGGGHAAYHAVPQNML